MKLHGKKIEFSVLEAKQVVIMPIFYGKELEVLDKLMGEWV